MQINYPNIYYRQIKNDDVDKGLNWLMENGDIDILAMVHRKQSVIERLMKGSHTKALAQLNHVPLMVFPANALPCGDKYF